MRVCAYVCVHCVCMYLCVPVRLCACVHLCGCARAGCVFPPPPTPASVMSCLWACRTPPLEASMLRKRDAVRRILNKFKWDARRQLCATRIQHAWRYVRGAPTRPLHPTAYHRPRPRVSIAPARGMLTLGASRGLCL
jgi:hypothetical protein